MKCILHAQCKWGMLQKSMPMYLSLGLGIPWYYYMLGCHRCYQQYEHQVYCQCIFPRRDVQTVNRQCIKRTKTIWLIFPFSWQLFKSYIFKITPCQTKLTKPSQKKLLQLLLRPVLITKSNSDHKMLPQADQRADVENKYVGTTPASNARLPASKVSLSASQGSLPAATSKE